MAFVLVTIAMFDGASVNPVAALSYGTCHSYNSNIIYYEYRTYQDVNGLTAKTTIRDVHPCIPFRGVSGNSFVLPVNLQSTHYFIQLGYGYLGGKTAPDFMVTAHDDTSGNVVYVSDLIGSDPVPYVIGDYYYYFEVGFKTSCSGLCHQWKFTIKNLTTGAVGSFYETAHVGNVDQSGTTEWWGNEVYNEQSQMGGHSSTLPSTISQMAWTYNWTDTGPIPWSYATATETGKICRDPSCTFPA